MGANELQHLVVEINFLLQVEKLVVEIIKLSIGGVHLLLPFFSFKARLPSQAPEIDSAVYLSQCDPSSFRSGDFAEVEIIGSQNYDLIARPVIPA